MRATRIKTSSKLILVTTRPHLPALALLVPARLLRVDRASRKSSAHCCHRADAALPRRSPPAAHFPNHVWLMVSGNDTSRVNPRLGARALRAAAYPVLHEGVRRLHPFMRRRLAVQGDYSFLLPALVPDCPTLRRRWRWRCAGAIWRASVRRSRFQDHHPAVFGNRSDVQPLHPPLTLTVSLPASHDRAPSSSLAGGQIGSPCRQCSIEDRDDETAMIDEELSQRSLRGVCHRLKNAFSAPPGATATWWRCRAPSRRFAAACWATRLASSPARRCSRRPIRTCSTARCA